MKKKTSPTFEAALYIGSCEGYHGKSFDRDELLDSINDFQEKVPDLAMPVRVMDCTFTMAAVDTSRYRENGWEVSAICYPNRPKPQTKVQDFIEALAQHLLNTFKQNRITVRCVSSQSQTVMYEAEDAQRKH